MYQENHVSGKSASLKIGTRLACVDGISGDRRGLGRGLKEGVLESMFFLLFLQRAYLLAVKYYSILPLIHRSWRKEH
jgi:hypothetical protein